MTVTFPLLKPDHVSVLDNLTYEGAKVVIKSEIAIAPATVAIAAGNSYFRNYKSGLLTTCACESGYGILLCVFHTCSV